MQVKSSNALMASLIFSRMLADAKRHQSHTQERISYTFKISLWKCLFFSNWQIIIFWYILALMWRKMIKILRTSGLNFVRNNVLFPKSGIWKKVPFPLQLNVKSIFLKSMSIWYVIIIMQKQNILWNIQTYNYFLKGLKTINKNKQSK